MAHERLTEGTYEQLGMRIGYIQEWERSSWTVKLMLLSFSFPESEWIMKGKLSATCTHN
jgi:hypothetical protein